MICHVRYFGKHRNQFESEMSQNRISHLEDCVIAHQVIMLCTVSKQSWLDTVFCCFHCDSCRSLLVAVNVILSAVCLHLHLL